MTQPPAHRDAIYARISQDREGAGLGIRRQVAECRELSERDGGTVVAVHSDNDVTAYLTRRKARPGYRALLDDVRAGRVDRVLVWHNDRLHRSPAELEEWIEACDTRKVPTLTVKAGLYDLSTPSNRMTARMVGAVARFESEHKGERVRAARQQAAAEGRYQGGKRPFGFEDDGMAHRPAEARAIARATEDVLGGLGLRAVARRWNSEGLRTTFEAQAWTSKTVRDVLVRPRNAGISTYLGEEVGRGVWEPIVPEERWRALVALVTDPGRRTAPQDNRVRWLGSGLYVCSTCGSTRMRASTSGQREAAYRCQTRDTTPRTGPHVTRKAVPLDEYVERVIVERLSLPDVAELLRAEPAAAVDTGPMHVEAVEVEQRLAQLSETFADGAITVAQLRAGTERLQRRLEVLRTELATAEAVDPLAGLRGVPNVAETWAGFDLSRKRAVLDALMTVTILPSSRRWSKDAPRFDPDSVKIEWKA